MRRVSLTQYLVEQQRKHDQVSSELRLLIEVVARACKAIGHAVSKGALADNLDSAGTDNVQGEAQKKLDVISNEVLLEANEWGSHLAAMASEEMEKPHQIPRDYPRGKDFNMRWVASMVADVYRILTRGGVFMYPSDAKRKDGRLRLMYEANPMAFIVEQAGGAATNGRKRILDIQPEALHQRVGVVLGSMNEVERITRHHAEN